MGVFANFLEKIFGVQSKNEVKTMSLADYLTEYERETLGINTYAMFTAVEMLANIMANCEIKTYRDGKEEKGLLWAKLNYQPNINQTATQFWREFYSKLLYEGQAMAFETFDGEQWIIADGFAISDAVILEKYFYDVYRGTFQSRISFPMSDVFYISYPNQNAVALKMGLLSRYDKLIKTATDSYEEGTGNKVFLNIPGAAMGAPNFEEKYKDLMENRFKSFFKTRNAVLPLWNGMQASFSSSSSSGKSSVKDITDLVTDSLSRAAQALKMSPALLTGDVAGLKDALNFTLTSAVDPLANVASETLSTRLWSLTEISRGNKAIVDTSNIKHIDVFDIATSVDKLISSGFATPDEARVFAGLEPTGEAAMQQHYFTKNYATIDESATAGGETNE